VSKVFTLAAICGLLVGEISRSEVTAYHQMLEGISPDEAVVARQYVERKYSPALRGLRGFHSLLLPPNAGTSYIEEKINSTYRNKLVSTEYGKLLADRAFRNTIVLRLYSDVPLKNGFVDWAQPMWVNDKTIRHELMGAFHAQDDVGGIIALNNYQSVQAGLTTFVHELFHMLDGNQPTGDSIDSFLAEYRAILAEVQFYLEFQRSEKNSKAFVKAYLPLSEWHESLLDKPFFGGEASVDQEKVFQATLDLLFPSSPQYKIGKIKLLNSKESPENTYALIKRSLIKIMSGRAFNEEPGLIEFSTDPIALQDLADTSMKTRGLIEDYFSSSANKELLNLQTIYNLREKGLNSAYNGHGGPRPRGPGG